VLISEPVKLMVLCTAESENNYKFKHPLCAKDYIDYSCTKDVLYEWRQYAERNTFYNFTGVIKSTL
jgi:hypothetical protein